MKLVSNKRTVIVDITHGCFIGLKIQLSKEQSQENLHNFFCEVCNLCRLWGPGLLRDAEDRNVLGLSYIVEFGPTVALKLASDEDDRGIDLIFRIKQDLSQVPDSSFHKVIMKHFSPTEKLQFKSE